MFVAQNGEGLVEGAIFCILENGILWDRNWPVQWRACVLYEL